MVKKHVTITIVRKTGFFQLTNSQMLPIALCRLSTLSTVMQSIYTDSLRNHLFGDESSSKPSFDQYALLLKGLWVMNY